MRPLAILNRQDRTRARTLPPEREAETPERRLVVLSCPWNHRHLWPADLEPYPADCMAKIASLPSGEWPNCGKHLHVSRYVVTEGESNE